MRRKLPGIVVAGESEGIKYDKSLQLHKEDDINEQVNARYAIDEALIENGYRNGTSRTQHGVNAEHIYIADYNIKETRLAAEQHRQPFYIEKSSEVNGPHDLVRGGEIYQLKYYKTAKGSLDACIEHMDKYPKDYQNNESAYYVIPKNHYETIVSIKNGEIPSGVSTRSANAIKKSIALFESKKGSDLEDTLLPGSVSYQDAFIEHNQQGNSDRHLSIDRAHNQAEEQIVQSHQPNLLDGIQTSIAAALIGGLVSTIVCWYQSKTTPISEWARLKQVVIGFLSTGIIAAIIYSLSMVVPVNVILVASFVIILKEMLVITFKHCREKHTLFDAVYSFNRGATEIIVSCIFIAVGYFGINQLTAMMIAKGYSIHFMIIILFCVFFSILIRLTVAMFFNHTLRSYNKKIDHQVNLANAEIEKNQIEIDYLIDLILEKEMKIKQYASHISNRKCSLEKRLHAITEVNKIIFTFNTLPTK